MTMTDGSWLFTEFSTRAFLGAVKELGDTVPSTRLALPCLLSGGTQWTTCLGDNFTSFWFL